MRIARTIEPFSRVRDRTLEAAKELEAAHRVLWQRQAEEGKWLTEWQRHIGERFVASGRARRQRKRFGRFWGRLSLDLYPFKAQFVWIVGTFERREAPSTPFEDPQRALYIVVTTSADETNERWFLLAEPNLTMDSAII